MCCARWLFFFFFKQKTAYEIMPSLVGSEMCIRDRQQTPQQRDALQAVARRDTRFLAGRHVDAAAGAAHGGSPEPLALQQNAVPESHATELHRAYPFASVEAVAGAASITLRMPLTA